MGTDMDKFIITIARGYGSGGRTVGKMLAEELGVPFYDRELLRMASEDSGINEELFGRADEKLKKSLLYRLMKQHYKGELIPPDSDDFVSNDNLFNYQAKIIKDLAEQESCIMVGRCADYILRNHKNVISLYVHAPFESCVARLMNMFGEPKKDLEKKITDIDKHRGEYYAYYTGRRWKDAQNYDLCINTDELTFEQVVEIVNAYIKVKRSNKTTA